MITSRAGTRLLPVLCSMSVAILPLPAGVRGDLCCESSQAIAIDNSSCGESGLFVVDNGNCAESEVFTIDNCPGGADFDGDGDVDLNDLIALVHCTSRPEVAVKPGCESKDLDHDGDVDQSDFGVFQQSLGIQCGN